MWFGPLFPIPSTGGSNRPVGDARSRGNIRDGQGIHDGRPAQWADRAAWKNRPRVLSLLGPQVSCMWRTGDGTLRGGSDCGRWYPPKSSMTHKTISLSFPETCKTCWSWRRLKRIVLAWWNTSIGWTTTTLPTSPISPLDQNCMKKLSPSSRNSTSTLPPFRCVERPLEKAWYSLCLWLNRATGPRYSEIGH